MSKKTGKKSIVSRIALAFMLLVVIALGVTFVLSRSGISFADTMRSLFGIKGEASDRLYYEKSEGKAFGDLKDAVAVASLKGVLVVGKDGQEIFNESFVMSSPAVHTAGKYGTAYDIGGKNLRFFTQDKNLMRLETEKPIISASVNKDGYLAVCTEDENYNGLVTVYNKKGSAVYKWHCSSGYVLSASVSEKGGVIVVIFADNGSNIVYLDLKSEEESARYVCGGIVLDACFIGDTVAAVSDKEIIYLTDKGESIASYDYSDKYLKAYSFGDGFTAVALGDYQFSTSSEIMTVDIKGMLTGSAQFSGGDISMDAAGNYLAVTGTGITKIYTSAAEEYASFDLSGTAGVLMMENGQVMILDSYSASVYPKK